MNLLVHPRPRTKLPLMMGLPALALVIAIDVACATMRSSLPEARIDQPHAVTDTALRLAEAVRRDVTAGGITHEQALERFRSVAHVIHFDTIAGPVQIETIADRAINGGTDRPREGARPRGGPFRKARFAVLAGC
jgi:hypothetical protein